MKSLQDPSDAKLKAKLLKPQAERRRRERMNRSLDSLRSLLLQRQEETRRRAEKAEILAHTVLFLRSAAAAGGQTCSFQHGFSACLQRAALFLGPGGKGPRLQAALDASFAVRVANSDSAGKREKRAVSKSPRLRQSVLQMLIHRPGFRLRTPAPGVRTPRVRTREEASGSTSAQSHGASRPQIRHPVVQSLWRPWP